MKVEYKKDTAIITPEKGKVLIRKADSKIFGEEPLWLGYTWFIGDKELEKPKLEVPDDYMDIDMPAEYKALMYPEEVENGASI